MNDRFSLTYDNISGFSFWRDKFDTYMLIPATSRQLRYARFARGTSFGSGFHRSGRIFDWKDLVNFKKQWDYETIIEYGFPTE